MDIATKTEQIPDYPLDVSMNALSDMAKILNALGNEDALAIFLLAKNGIVSSKDAIQALGLTQKRFYTRLKELMDNKLIEKVEGAYRHTALGEILCNIGLSMEKLLLDKDKLKIMSQLSKVKNLSEKQKNELMQFFSIDLSLGSKDVKIIDSFDELVSVTVDIFNNATEMVYIATQYIDVRVINAGFKALERGVKMRGLISEIDQISNALKIAFSILTNPRQISVIRNFLSSANSQARTVKLHYTFIIADGKRSVMEIKDPFVDEFKFAICINSEKISKKLVEVFESYWNQGKEILNNIKI
jgi:hypothetical protein